MEEKIKQKWSGCGVGNEMWEVQIKLWWGKNYCTKLCAMPLRLTVVRDVHLAREIIVQGGD